MHPRWTQPAPGAESRLPHISRSFRRADRSCRKILGSRDFITLFRGGAGTGKSFALKEVERGLVAGNRPLVVLAPQRQQVQDLQAEGLKADTVASLLQAKQLPRGAVVIVDEAGQVGGRDLAQLIRTVHANQGRLILSGDTRQHGPVAASTRSVRSKSTPA